MLSYLQSGMLGKEYNDVVSKSKTLTNYHYIVKCLHCYKLACSDLYCFDPCWYDNTTKHFVFHL